MTKIPTNKIAAVVDAIVAVPGTCSVRQSKGKILAFDLVSVNNDVRPTYSLDVATGELVGVFRDGITRETHDHHAKANTIGLVRKAIERALAPIGPEEKYALAYLSSGRWVPMRGAGTWAEWRADAPSDVETVRVTVQRDGLTVVVWEGHPDEMPKEAPKPASAASAAPAVTYRARVMKPSLSGDSPTHVSARASWDDVLRGVYDACVSVGPDWRVTVWRSDRGEPIFDDTSEVLPTEEPG